MKPHPIQQGDRAKARQLPRSLIQDLRSAASPKNRVEKTKPSASHGYSQRVRLSRFFGASPVASALDLRSGRDPETKVLKLSCSARWEVDRLALLTHHLLAECQQAE